MSQPTKLRNRTGRNQAPPSNPNSNRLITGLVLLAVLLGSVFALWKPLAPRAESLSVTPPQGTTAAQLKKAMADTGALPNLDAVRISEDGSSFAVVSADLKNPISKTTWDALVRTIPTKLTGAKAVYVAKAPPLINLGLDLQGGLRVLLEAQGNPTADDLEQVRTVIENRVNATGVAEPLVQRQGNNRVVVELPGLSQADQSRALSLVGQTAKLEFRIVNQASQGKTDTQLTESDLGPALMTGEGIEKAVSAFDQFGAPYVSMTFTGKGTNDFGRITSENVGRRMAIVLDGKVKSAPNINQAITGGQAQITGSFTLDQTNDLSLVLRSGSLRVPVQIIETRAIGPTLGQDAIRQGFVAALIGVGGIFVLVFVYYGLWFGLVAALGLIFSAITIFGILAGLGGVLTLPGIAGLVLTIGSAVDGNVISFERIKEELHLGKPLKSAIKAGFGHSFWTIFDVNFSHLISAVSLYQYATGPVKGFAVTLAVGVIASTFSNLVFSRWFLELLANWRGKFSAPHWFDVPKIHFMEAAKYITTMSLILAVLGGVAIFTKGFTFGVDFTSGTSLTVRTADTVKSDQVRQVIGASGIKNVSASNTTIIESRTPGTTGKDFTVRVGELDQAGQFALRDAFLKLPGSSVTQIETVGPSVGRELRNATIAGVLVALGLTLLYVGIRFDLILGVGSVLAVAHDVAIVFGLYAILGREFTITTVAAILTLIGYSLNDSIIVSDRIRENLKVMRGQPYAQIVNTSINQTLSRTIMTSVGTMLPLLALLIMGGPVLRDFSLVLVIGILVGTYSSIYIVAPMAVFYKNWQDARKKPQRMAKV
jgi:SecD/SecF fusion protein